jgi:murein DD-endopeptidase MepM/ murein hydrolase activator NlpD
MMMNVVAPLLLAALAPLYAAPCAITLPTELAQGDFVRGSAAQGVRVQFGARTLALTQAGEFVFGLAYNAPATGELRTSGANCAGTVRFAVAQRQYRTERVNGLPQNTVTPDPETAKRIAKEGALIQTARAISSDLRGWQSAFQWPAVGRESGVYGSSRIINGLPSSPHLGLDMAAPSGTPVLAALPGTVSLVHQDMIMTGKTVQIDHGFGISTIYIHMSSVAVKQGASVTAGQQIGAIGTTGRSSGPHLHFQVQWFQEKLDPARVLPARKP